MTNVENDEVAQRIRRVFVQSLALDLDADDPQLAQDLHSVAGLDSLAKLEFVAGLEKEFGFEIEPELLNLALLSNLSALTRYIVQRLGGRSSTEDESSV